MNFNLSAIAVRERAITLFFIILLAPRAPTPSSCSGGRRTPPSPSRP